MKKQIIDKDLAEMEASKDEFKKSLADPINNLKTAVAAIGETAQGAAIEINRITESLKKINNNLRIKKLIKLRTRNTSCLCGSGKKYKKCCLFKNK